MLLGTVGLAPPKRRKLLSYCIVFLLVSGCLLQVACGGTSSSGVERRHGWHPGWHLHNNCYRHSGLDPPHNHGDIDGAVMP